MASRTAYSTWTPQKPTLFDGHYLRNRSTLDIGVLGYIGIVQHKEHSHEVLSIPPGTPCIPLLGPSCVCLAFSCCCIVLVARKAIFKCVCLNTLDIFLTNGLKYVRVTHLFRGVFVYCCCCCVQFCLSALFLFVNFVLNRCIRAGG